MRAIELDSTHLYIYFQATLQLEQPRPRTCSSVPHYRLRFGRSRQRVHRREVQSCYGPVVGIQADLYRHPQHRTRQYHQTCMLLSGLPCSQLKQLPPILELERESHQEVKSLHEQLPPIQELERESHQEVQSLQVAPLGCTS